MTFEQLPYPRNILVFGASGKTGQLVVEKALAEKYQVKAFVRVSERLPISNKHLSIFTGNVTEINDIEQAVKGADAVISVLGWAKVRRADLAHFLVQQIGSNEFVKKAPMIAS